MLIGGPCPSLLHLRICPLTPCCAVGAAASLRVDRRASRSCRARLHLGCSSLVPMDLRPDWLAASSPPHPPAMISTLAVSTDSLNRSVPCPRASWPARNARAADVAGPAVAAATTAKHRGRQSNAATEAYRRQLVAP